VLTRKPKRKDARDSIKITGRINGQFIAEPADGFGPPFPISEGELATAYGLKDAAEVESEHDRFLRIDAEANATAADKLFEGRATRPEPDPASPEGVFAAAAATEVEGDNG
jgi:hypothetical protein